MMHFDKTLLGSVTVWYNPEQSFIDNIQSYSAYSTLLVVVDNSTADNQALFNTIKHSNKVYIPNRENAGIAKAFNQGINLLIEKGFKYAFTFDQDSFFKTGEIEKLLTSAKNLDWKNTGILSPIHVQQKSTPVYNSVEYKPVTTVMASGNILNLEAVATVGFFKEELFIDHVDNEFCLRLNKNGFKVLVANAFLTHKLGNYREAHMLGVRAGGFISHSPERLYYFVKNSLYIIRNYASVDYKYALSEATAILKRFVKIFFEDNKGKRFKLFFKGIADSHKLK